MAWTRAALILALGAALAAAIVSGGSSTDPRTPAGLPGLPPPYLGVALAGDGSLTAAVDAYGDVVDLRAGPAGRALIDNPPDRQAAGTVAPGTGIVPRVRVGDGSVRPLWRADSVRQRYLAGANAVVTVARFGGARARIVYAVTGGRLFCVAQASAGATVTVATADPPPRNRLGFVATAGPPKGTRLACDGRAARAVQAAIGGDRRWLARARPLGLGAPVWARAMYGRSLLTLRALTDRRSGAVAAGARDGWAYVWPRDASAAAIAFAAAGYRSEAERVTRFLLGLGLEHAARFHGDGSPVPGRAAQGDAIGWVAAAAAATGSIGSARHAARILAGGAPVPWRARPDYREGEPGDYLANALAAHADVSDFLLSMNSKNSDAPAVGLVREAGDPDSGLDSAAAWAVRPFSRPRLYPAARASLMRLASRGTRFGITPGEGWPGGDDPWSAPTAWTAWSLAALGERQEALRLLGALRRSATPTGDLPERVDAQTGIPTSTTPLAWSHAFAILALRELWPS